jgi:hypothetical protein
MIVKIYQQSHCERSEAISLVQRTDRAIASSPPAADPRNGHNGHKVLFFMPLNTKNSSSRIVESVDNCEAVVQALWVT